MERRLWGTESWDAGESGGVAHYKLGLAEESKAGFEKFNLRTLTDPTSDVVEKTNGEVDDVADKGERQRL